ncbi:MAG: DUF547 domain-containing protein [Chitinophagales bacterium]
MTFKNCIEKASLLLLSLFLLIGCSPKYKISSKSDPITHETWDSLLKVHVNNQGLVDYKGFQTDRKKLDTYLQKVSEHHPNDKNWSKEEQMAYWINAYNAFTVQLILDNYPVESIKDVTSGPSISFVNSPWDIKFIEIEGAKYDLNNIEHNFLRKRFEDPRIHVGVNCASASCPALPQFAFTADKLYEQLDQQARLFINDPSKNKITSNNIQISKIFKWFEGDFTKNGTLIDFLNKYSDTKINANASVDYLDYNWSLNEAK